MNNHRVNGAFNSLVMMDFSEASYTALKYAVSMAIITDGRIHVCHVGSPEKIVESDNQIAALRAIEYHTKKVKKKLGSIAEIIAAEGVRAICHYPVGNIISELQHVVDKIKPNLIVVGKKTGKSKFAGKLSSFLLNEYSGSVLVVGEGESFRNNTKIALACNENTLYRYDPDVVHKIDRHTKSSLTVINVRTPNQVSELINLPERWQPLYTTNLNVRFEYKTDPKVVNALLTHIEEEKIELLCVGRGKQRGFLQNLFYGKVKKITEIIDNVRIPVLIMGSNCEQFN